MLLSAMHTPSRDDDQHIYISNAGQIFFSSVPDGVFHLLSSFTHQEEFGRIHCVIDSNRLSKAHSERNLRQYSHHIEPLFNTFTSIEALRWVLFVKNIDARGCELYLRDPESGGNQTEYLSRSEIFIQACKAGELDIVKAVVERTQVDIEARNEYGNTPLFWAAGNGHIPVVQYLREQGGDKDARNESDRTPLHLAADNGHLPVVQYSKG